MRLSGSRPLRCAGLLLPTGKRKDLIAQAWCGWEMATSRLEVDPDYLARADSEEFADVFRWVTSSLAGEPGCMTYSRIEAHYFQNGGFLREGQLLEKAEIDKIRHIPAVIVQGRYDCGAFTRLASSWRRVRPFAHSVSGDERVGPAPGLARGRLPSRPECRPLREGARHRA
jgi:proline iminopeptidase